MPRDLLQTQSLFWQLTQNPRGVAAVLKDLPLTYLSDFLHGSNEDDCVTRMEIYTQAYFIRIYESLLEDYPATLAVLGEEKFQQLCRDYLQACPSTNFDLTMTSAQLPEFLHSHEHAREQTWLRDLARLEWENIAVMRTLDPSPLTVKSLQSYPAESWGRLKFTRIVASRLLHVDVEAHARWRQYLKLPATTYRENPTHVLIWRKGFDSHSQLIDKTENEILQILSRPISFQEICDHIAHFYPGNTHKAAAFLQNWLKLGILEMHDPHP